LSSVLALESGILRNLSRRLGQSRWAAWISTVHPLSLFLSVHLTKLPLVPSRCMPKFPEDAYGWSLIGPACIHGQKTLEIWCWPALGHPHVQEPFQVISVVDRGLRDLKRAGEQVESPGL
jgi:hypothetical protein